MSALWDLPHYKEANVEKDVIPPSTDLGISTQYKVGLFTFQYLFEFRFKMDFE